MLTDFDEGCSSLSGLEGVEIFEDRKEFNDSYCVLNSYLGAAEPRMYWWWGMSFWCFCLSIMI